jgi:hypothetical protein
MSALGHKRTFRYVHVMSALPPKADNYFLPCSSMWALAASSGGVCMMPRFFVPPAFMMFGCLTVMMRGMRMMFRGLLMVLGCFF